MNRLAAVALAIACCSPQGGAAAPDAGAPVRSGAPAPGDLGRLVDVGSGRRLYLECRGSGSPTVILESGFRNDADIWSIPAAGPTPVLPGAARFTRVCAYDRPGTLVDADRLSRSDPVPMPRDAADVVADLAALLRAADVAEPLVLVAHSLGGVFARLFASAYPDAVVGLVLVDAWPERIEALLGPEDWSVFERLVVQPPPGLEDYRDLELYDLAATSTLMLQTAAASRLRRIPLTVLSRGRPLDLPSDVPAAFPAALEQAWGTGQAELATLAPRGRHVVADSSQHYVQLDQPQLVIRAVRSVVEAVRAGTVVACQGGSVFCRARVGIGGGASGRKITIQLTDPDLRLVSVRPNRRALVGAYELSPGRRRRGRLHYVTTLTAAQAIPPGSRLIFTFRAPTD